MVHALRICFSLIFVLTGMLHQTEMYRYLKMYNNYASSGFFVSKTDE